MNHNNTYFFSNTQYFNHTAPFMEATIFENKPETHSKDSMLFCKMSCRISFCTPQMASSKRFREITASPNARQVNIADRLLFIGALGRGNY